MADIIVPQIIEVRQLKRQIHDAYYIWRVGYDKAHPIEPIRNVRFIHDPDWRNSPFSLQNARDGNTWFWKATHVVVRIGVPIGAAAWPFLFS